MKESTAGVAEGQTTAMGKSSGRAGYSEKMKK